MAKLIELWKKELSTALPQVVEPHALDHVLQQYYLTTDTPTIDYIYSFLHWCKGSKWFATIIGGNFMEDLKKEQRNYWQ